MDKGAWWATVHGVAKSWTQLSTHTPPGILYIEFHCIEEKVSPQKKQTEKRRTEVFLKFIKEQTKIILLELEV